MSISSIVLIVLTVIIVVALGILYKTRKRLKEIDCFKSIKGPEDEDDGVIGSFGEK